MKSIFYVTESLLYHSIISTRKKYEKYYLCIHEKLSNVTQNMDDFWPRVMSLFVMFSNGYGRISSVLGQR